MKNWRCYGIAVCLLSATFVSGQVKSDSPQGQIEPLLLEMDAAANAHDTDRFMAAYLHQPSLTFVVDGMVIHGWTQLRLQQAEWWSNGTDVVYAKVGEPEFTVLSADTVIVTETMTASASGKNGHAIKMSLAASMVWKKMPDGWKIIYGHESSEH